MIPTANLIPVLILSIIDMVGITNPGVLIIVCALELRFEYASDS